MESKRSCFYAVSRIAQIILCTVLCALSASYAAEQAAFLKISPGARQTGMADACSAVSGDGYSIYYNPAGLADISKNEVSFSYNRWIMDSFTGYAASVIPITGGQVVGAGLNYFSSGDITKTGEDGNGAIIPNAGSFNASEYAFSLSYGRKISALRTGLNLNFIKSGVDELYNDLFSFDLGIKYLFSSDLRTSLVLKNIGDSRLPANAVIGFAKKFMNDNLTTEIDATQYFSGRTRVALGGSYDYSLGDSMSSVLSARAGYRTGYTETGDISGLTAGAGYSATISGIKYFLDFSFSFYGFLGDSSKVSFSARF